MLLTEISRLVPKLVRLDDFEQSYDKVNFVIKMFFDAFKCLDGYIFTKLGPNFYCLVPTIFLEFWEKNKKKFIRFRKD